MKKFRFRYENILKLRIDYEEEVKTRLKKLNQELNHLEGQKAETELAYHVYKTDVENAMKTGLKGYEIQHINQFQNYYRDRIEALQLDIRHMERRIEDTKFELMEAIKERKIMEKLKEKDLKLYNEAINVMEGKATDEVVNFQNSRRSGG